MRPLIKPLLALLVLWLALWLIWGFWPLGNGSRLFLSAVALLLAALWGWRYARRGREVLLADESVLPPEQFAGAVVLVCGASDLLFPAGQAFRETRQGWYIAVRGPEQLASLADSVAAGRPALISRLSVLLAVIPEQWQEAEALNSQLLEWQRAIAGCRRAFSALPPVWVSCWLNAIDARPDGPYSWYSLTSNRDGIQVQENSAVARAYTAWCGDNGAEMQIPRLSHSLWLQTLFSWLKPQVLAGLASRYHDTPALPPCMLTVCTGPVTSVPDNLWQQHTGAMTTIPARAGDDRSPLLPLPDALLAHLPHRNGMSSLMKHCRIAGMFVGLFLLLAMLASWINNQRLIQNVSDHLMLYRHLNGTPETPKLQAQNQLRRDDALLDGWQRDGAPMRYTLGLYQGMRLIPPLRASINNWAPSQPHAPAIQQIVQAPKIIRLDSLSLFDTGKFELKSGSQKVLINALVGIKAKPGWLIVVSGHTDSTGHSQLNQALSLKRAAAVRDWMRDTGDVSPTCFAVQGYGATRPVATNDTPEGRALNRRVEISLVPQADACLAPAMRTSSQDDDTTVSSDKE